MSENVQQHCDPVGCEPCVVKKHGRQGLRER